MTGAGPFTHELFDFLGDLAANNDRDWFQDHKNRYAGHVKDPLLAFISAFSAPLAEFAPRLLADPRPVGGSMFRIHRDTRFSKDKSPYKTHAAAHFRHEACSRDVHGPGYYLHLEPGEVMAGAGLWEPPPEVARHIREAIVDRPDEWTAATRSPGFTKLWTPWGESYKRVPAGFDPAHPLADDLKRKHFVVMAHFDEPAACRPDFLDRYASACRAAAPMMRFLSEAVGLDW